ncbi:hypothetical protein [Photobacterium carnosum]|uniref:Uncharacterized protein n=1 Tax=Photobacterium carnosum TaxID=2023717 RepID=A0A2N4UQS0_9GAMM|nr:hypothetical protein [Photobacterium carnosum]PLC57367.1 hypothetical protein CIK00_13835 [Photobacterium carnosum]
MSKKENTLYALEAALERILQQQTKRIPSTRKLSVRAVEEEANLGNGSGYYYPEIITKIKKAKINLPSHGESPTKDVSLKLRDRIKKETKIKEKYKQKKNVLKSLVSKMATDHHHFNDALRKANAQIDELEKINTELRNQLADFKRNKIKNIN